MALILFKGLAAVFNFSGLAGLLAVMMMMMAGSTTSVGLELILDVGYLLVDGLIGLV